MNAARAPGAELSPWRAESPPLALWERAVVFVALVRSVAALSSVALGVPSAPGPVLWPFVRVDSLEVLLFAAVGGFLLTASRLRAPASHLGGFLLAVGSAYASRPVGALAALLPDPARELVRALGALHPDAFLAYFLWAFVARFPAAAPAPARTLRRALALLAAAGGVLFAATFANAGPFGFGAVARVLAPIARGVNGGVNYWRFVFTVAVLAIPYAFWKLRRTPPPERERLTLFTIALTVGYGPVFVDSLVSAWLPSYDLHHPVWLRHVILALLLTTPLTTAYAVVVHRVLDVKLVVRRALQYALARGTVVALTAIPFLALLVYLAEHRTMPIGELVSGARPLLLIAAVGVGVLGIALGGRLLASTDRRFFREEVDAGRTIAAVVERSRRTGSVEELSDVIEREVDRALHPSLVSVLLADRPSGHMVAHHGRLPWLRAGSALAGLLEGSAEPLEVDLEDRRSPLAQIPEDERRWLSAGGVRLLVPLVGTDGGVLGLLALGEKRSELPYSRADRSLLTTLAASAAVALENRLLRTSSGGGSGAHGTAPQDDVPSGEPVARECLACGLVHPATAEACTCGEPLKSARVPHVLLGKFRLEKRIGAGGMGVVYRARDLALGRAVALKMLPRVSPEYAMRLRREARAAASLSHPGIALVYGSESWCGTPILVFELLGGGTLADRLASAALLPDEVVPLGIALADALAAAHGRGVLHRDLKPSNIGFSDEGALKLLDFGLARILHDGRSEGAFFEPDEKDVSRAQTSPLTLQTISASGHAGYVVGTPAYMSPEAIVGNLPDESVDLWAAALVLYESLTRRNPFVRPTVMETFRAVRKVVAPDVREAAPHTPPALARLIADGLAHDRARRPASASELRARLLALS